MATQPRSGGALRLILVLTLLTLVVQETLAVSNAACMDAGKARVASFVAQGECASGESCSVCVLESAATAACGSEMICRVLVTQSDGSSQTTSGERDIKIEEQWLMIPVAPNSSALDEGTQSNSASSSVDTQAMQRVLSTGHLTIDGWGVVDGKPNMTLALADHDVAGFSNLSVLKLRNLSLQYIQLPKLPKLHTLDLSGDGLMVLDGVLPRDMFAKASQPSLTLSLQHNMLIEVPSSVFDMPSLRVLQLQHNAIKKQRLSVTQFEFLSTTLTRLEVDADAFQTSGCDGNLVTFKSNPSVSICDPSLWLQIPGSNANGGTPSSSSSSSSATNNQKTIDESSGSSSSSWSAWVGGIAAFLVIAAAVCFAFTRKETLKEMLQGRLRDSRGQHAASHHDGVVTVFRDRVQQQSDAECYRVFQDAAFSDSSTLSLNEQMFESWRRDPRLITLTRPLGSKGQKALTWLGTYRGDNVVVKTLPNSATESERTLFTFDMKTTARFSHPNLIRFRGVAWSSDTGMQALLEYMDRGDLQTYLAHSRGGLVPVGPPATAGGGGSGNGGGGATAFAAAASGPSLACWWGTRLLDIALDVAQALLYLHTMKRVSHCALTSRHVLLNHEYSAKLSNFMFVQSLAEYGAQSAQPSSPSSPSSASSKSGRVAAFKASSEFVRWSAPEVLSSSSSGSNALSCEAVDIYSFGILLSELDTLEYPFERAQREAKWNEAQLRKQLAEGSLKPSISLACPGQARDLLLACLSKDPCERPTAATVVQTLREIAAEIERESSLTAGYFAELRPVAMAALER